jgi:hypothetical protein
MPSPTKFSLSNISLDLWAVVLSLVLALLVKTNIIKSVAW